MRSRDVVLSQCTCRVEPSCYESCSWLPDTQTELKLLSRSGNQNAWTGIQYRITGDERTCTQRPILPAHTTASSAGKLTLTRFNKFLSGNRRLMCLSLNQIARQVAWRASCELSVTAANPPVDVSVQHIHVNPSAQIITAAVHFSPHVALNTLLAAAHSAPGDLPSL